MTINWRAFNLNAWRRLDPQFRSRAVAVLREKIPSEDQEKIHKLADADTEWFAEYHMIWGMYIRNELRKAGLTDSLLPVSVHPQNEGDQNWDDYYGACVEVAVKAGVYHQLDESERA